MADENPNKAKDHRAGQDAAKTQTTPVTANPNTPGTSAAEDWNRGWRSQCFTRVP